MSEMWLRYVLFSYSMRDDTYLHAEPFANERSVRASAKKAKYGDPILDTPDKIVYGYDHHTYGRVEVVFIKLQYDHTEQLKPHIESVQANMKA